MLSSSLRAKRINPAARNVIMPAMDCFVALRAPRNDVFGREKSKR
jgi:hypothetical protein